MMIDARTPFANKIRISIKAALIQYQGLVILFELCTMSMLMFVDVGALLRDCSCSISLKRRSVLSGFYRLFNILESPQKKSPD